MKVTEITEIDFDETVLNSSGVVVVKFFGSWCGPCKMLARVIEEMPEFDNLKIVEVDIDKCMPLARQYSVMSVPTMIVFKDGAEIDKVVGFRTANQLTEMFNGYITE